MYKYEKKMGKNYFLEYFRADRQATAPLHALLSNDGAQRSPP
jgi:hypothetical protein